MSLFSWPNHPTTDLEVLPAAVQNIGVVRQATESESRFTIRNRASQTIQILDAVTSCSCAGIDFSKKELAPGESASLALRWNSGGSRGSFVVRATIVYRNAGEEQSHVLTIGLTARIDPDYAVEPERLEFGPHKPLVQRVVLAPRHGSELKIGTPTCNLRFFTARVLTSEPADKHTVEVSYKPEEYYRDAGPGELLIPTNCQRQQLVRIPLHVTTYPHSMSRDQAVLQKEREP